MESTSELPIWVIPIIVVGFPIVFIGFWSFVCAILAAVSGYRSLLEFRVNDAEAKADPLLARPVYAMIGVVSYRGGVLTLRSGHRGLTLQVLRLFPFHPPTRIPWEQVHLDGDGSKGLFGPRGAILLAGRVRLRIPKAVLVTIHEAKEKFTAGAGNTA